MIWALHLADIKPLYLTPESFARAERRRLLPMLYLSRDARAYTLMCYPLLLHRIPASWKLWRDSENVHFNYSKDKIVIYNLEDVDILGDEVAPECLAQIQRVQFRVSKHPAHDYYDDLFSSGIAVFAGLREVEIQFFRRPDFRCQSLTSFCSMAKVLKALSKNLLEYTVAKHYPEKAKSKENFVYFPSIFEHALSGVKGYPRLVFTLEGTDYSQPVIFLNKAEYEKKLEARRLWLEGATSTISGQKLFELIEPIQSPFGSRLN